MAHSLISQKPSSAKARQSFSLPSSSLAASRELRFDAAHYSPGFFEAVRVLEESGMRLERLGDITTRVFIPPRFKRVYVEKEYGVPFIQGSHIVHFRPADLKFLSRAHHRLEKWTIRGGWILVTCSGTIGRSALCPPEWDGWAGSQDILRIVPDESKCLAGYLCSFLSSALGQAQFTANVYGAVVDELTEEQARGILVPVPETSQDKELALSIDEAMKQSSGLKSHAVSLVEDSLQQLANRFAGD